MPLQGFTPAAATFQYKKYSFAPNPQNISLFDYEIYLYPTKNYKVTNIPAWLDVYNVYYATETSSVYFDIRVNTTYAQSMLPGTYSVDLGFQFDRERTYDFANYFWEQIILTRTLKITIDIKDGLVLTLAPTTMLFPYTIGDPTPAVKPLQISSASNWAISADHNWVNFSAVNGLLSSQITIGVDPSGLPVGNYQSIVTVSDNSFTKEMIVTLIVSEGDTALNYLYVIPRNLEFTSEFSVENTKERIVNLESSSNWTAVRSQDWIQLNNSAGLAGINDVIVTVDSALLPVGNYIGEIIFTCNDIIKKVFVSLSVLAYLEEGIQSDGLYFADDRNKLKVNSNEDNSFLVLDVSASTENNSYIYQYEAPFFKGLSNIVIGLEANNLLKSTIPDTVFITRIKNNISPLNINISSFSENKITSATQQLSQYGNLKFLTGKTPVIANKLCYVPQTIYVTKNAILSLSLLATVAPTQIVISGDVNTVISTSISDNLYVYNAIINLSDFALATGNAITITFGSLTVNVVIKKEVPETHLIAFENEWKEYEFFETTGFLTKTKDADKTDTELQIEGEKHTKTVSIDIGKDYILNTGYIYSQEEVDWLSMILDAKRIFIYEGTNPVEIILETKSMQIYKTREYGNSYLLKFKTAIV